MELGEYDHRLGANDPTDFPGERFKEKELESNPSDSTGNLTVYQHVIIFETGLVYDQVCGPSGPIRNSNGHVRTGGFFEKVGYF